MNRRFTSYYLDSPFVQGRVFDVFEPEGTPRDTAVFLIHGGGWTSGTRVVYHRIMEALNRRGYLTGSADYRLGGVTVLDQLRDVREAYDRFITLLKQMDRPLKVAVHGGSAGAHLASLLLCAGPGECGEKCELENDWVRPVRGTLQATPNDFLRKEWMMPQMWAKMQSVAGVPFEKDPGLYERLSLSHHIRPGNPPLFFIEAELEHLFPSRYTLEFVRKHREWGIPSQWKVYDGMEHGFFYELVRKGQIEAFEDVCAFLEGSLETL
ncbi:MAG: alpha/beta hydrolase [Lentisphaeria bacterium]|nr:alpha/beta hydrolase [Lentisphaeria bacterium]